MFRMVLLIVFVACSGRCFAQSGAPAVKHLLIIGEEKGYRHEAVSHAAATLERLGRESGLWSTTIRTDIEALTKKKLEYNAKNLNDFDAVVFYTGGELEMNAEQKAALYRLCTTMGRVLSVCTARRSLLLTGRSTGT